MKALPDFGDHMDIWDWGRAVAEGAFIPEDGSVYLASKSEIEERESTFSEVVEAMKARSHTHVMWFNK